MIETINGSGSYVTGARIDKLNAAFKVYSVLVSGEKEMYYLLDSRAALEGEAASKLAESGDKNAIDQLKKALIDMRKSKVSSEFSQLDLISHNILLRSTGNDMFNLLGDALKDRNLRCMGEIFESNKGVWLETIEEHQKIILVIESGDVEKSRVMTQEHIWKFKSRWKESVGN